MSKQPYGSWMDDDGVCKVCGGEIPHGHSNSCDVYRYERIEKAAEEMRKVLTAYRDAYARATDSERVEMWTKACEALALFEAERKERK